jgi:molybdopterin converting factor small subunit
MPVTVRIPTPLRSYTDGQSTAEAEGDTVGTALDDLAEQYPDLREQLYGEDDQLRSFVNVYVGDEDIRHTGGADTPLDGDEEVSIVPAVAGGTWVREGGGRKRPCLVAAPAP